MQRQYARPTGPGAGVIKYDVITALSVMALRQSQTVQTTVLRLIALVTARYNWKLDQFTVPQADMARMWNVSERTVKREIKRLVTAELIDCLKPGVRGRVAAYRINYTRLADQSRDSWSAVGHDFDHRMQSMRGPAEAKVVKVDFGSKPALPPQELPAENDLWGRVLHHLAAKDPANLHNWYMKLSLVRVEGRAVVLSAPSGFVAQFVQTHLVSALASALRHEIGHQVHLQITYDGAEKHL